MRTMCLRKCEVFGAKDAQVFPFSLELMRRNFFINKKKWERAMSITFHQIPLEEKVEKITWIRLQIDYQKHKNLLETSLCCLRKNDGKDEPHIYCLFQIPNK